eukprot:347257-Prymnesium_polylepis.2
MRPQTAAAIELKGTLRTAASGDSLAISTSVRRTSEGRDNTRGADRCPGVERAPVTPLRQAS